MPIRNPFARRPGGAPAQEESGSRPGTANGDAAHPGFERVDTVGSKASTSALSIRSGKSQDNGEYKMSVVNDSGVYLPPSPTEKDSTWPRRYLSRTSTDTRSDHGEIEHFSISRESFDSYRRSFDISARSPVVLNDPAPRQSLDSARFPRLPRSAVSHRRSNLEQEPPTPEESFEDVGLNDEGKLGQQPVRKRGFFKFGGSDHPPAAENTSPAPAPVNGAQGTQMMSRFLPGRKRGQSGSGLGAELGSMTNIDRPKSATSVETAEVQTLPPPQVQVQHA